MNYSKTYQIQVYRDFKEIESDSYHSITRFFEEREPEIRQLEFNEYFEVLVAYTHALFETGSYQKHLRMADVVIETSILRNIQTFQGEDVYWVTLFRKACSYFNMMRYNKTDYILRELIKMNPFHTDAISFLKRCLRKNQPQFIKNARAISVLLFLISALIISVEVLVIRHFFEAHTTMIEPLRTAVFIAGLVVLIGSDLFHRWKVNKEVDDFVKMVKKKEKPIQEVEPHL